MLLTCGYADYEPADYAIRAADNAIRAIVKMTLLLYPLGHTAN